MAADGEPRGLAELFRVMKSATRMFQHDFADRGE